MEATAKTILMVEDETLVALDQARMLEESGYSLIHAESPSRTWEALDTQQHIDMILMDIDLGNGVDGRELAREILESHSIPLVFLTAHAEADVVKGTQSITNYGYILKNSGEGVILSCIDMAFKLAGTHQKALEASATWQRTFDGSGDGIAVLDENGAILQSNLAFRQMFGDRSGSYLGERCFEVVHKTLDHVDGCPLVRARQSGHRERMELQIQERNFVVTVDPFHQGTKICYVHTVADITELKRAQEKVLELLREKDILIREVHHRVKNNLGTISSLLSLQSSYLKDESTRQVLKDARGRIFGMMEIYNILMKNPDLGTIEMDNYLSNLIQQIASCMVIREDLHVRKDLDPIVLPSRLAYPVGIMVNELVTNSLKYAFPEGGPGTISISLKNSDKGIILSVSDDGVGFPEDVDHESVNTFGFLIVRAMANQLGATIQLSSESGTTVTMVF